MKITCPICQSRYDLEEAATTAALREMVALASKFGRTWGLVEEYVDTFRTSQWGSISLKKRVRLLQELARLWQSAEFEYNGKRYRTDHVQIRAALNTVCNSDKWGFKNHNYLKKILLDGAKRVSASGHTAAEEREREAKPRTEETGEKDMTAAEYKARKGIESLADQVGREML